MTHANVIGGTHSKMARAVGVSLVLVLLMRATSLRRLPDSG